MLPRVELCPALAHNDIPRYHILVCEMNIIILWRDGKESRT